MSFHGFSIFSNRYVAVCYTYTKPIRISNSVLYLTSTLRWRFPINPVPGEVLFVEFSTEWQT